MRIARLVITGFVLLAAATSAQAQHADQPNLIDRVVADAQRKCVKIYGGAIARERGFATGLLVSDEGHILAAQGIYLAGDRIRAITPDAVEHTATVVRRDDGLQVAMLKIDALTPDFFALDDQPAAMTGDWVVALTNAFNVADPHEPLSANLGVVSMRGELDTRKRAQDFDVEGQVLLVDAITSNPGSPGGALITVDGRLAGMVGKVLESESTNTRLNYAVPNDLLARFVAGREAGPNHDGPRKPGKPVTGIRIFTLSGKRAPAYIDRVIADSPADRAGLRKDDLVLEINKTWVRHVRDYQETAGALRPGDTVEMIVKRGSEILRVTFTVARAPEEDREADP
jgi:serine protease Do